MHENSSNTHIKEKIIVCVVICAILVLIVLQPMRLQAPEQIDYHEIATVIDAFLSDLAMINQNLTEFVAVEDEQTHLIWNRQMPGQPSGCFSITN